MKPQHLRLCSNYMCTFFLQIFESWWKLINPDLNFDRKTGETAFLIAARGVINYYFAFHFTKSFKHDDDRDLRLCQWLAGNKANICAIDSYGNTALHSYFFTH